jgi:hypothetical protein
VEYIAHRVNTVQELSALPCEYGVELDLRDYEDTIRISHDPFVKGELFSDYLDVYRHGTMILNIKSERIEHRVLELIEKKGIKNYFFLDSSFPMIYQLMSKGEKNCAIRFSEYEGLDTILSVRGKVNWVWVDCFTKLPITQESYEILKKSGFRICLVSPELQGRESDIEKYREYLKDNNILFDAICTKYRNIQRWQS